MTEPPSPDALRLTNGVVDVGIPTAHGPRIAHYGFTGGTNVLGDGAGVERATPRGLWRAYGGHRLWAAPEIFPDTYTIDDAPPQVEASERRAVVRRARDETTGLIASIEIELEPAGTGVTVRHAIANDGPAARRLAPWAITVAAPGGTAVIPQPHFAPQPQALLPARTMALWRYTDLSDARFAFGPAFLRLRCDASSPQPNKIGVACERGWFAYLTGGSAFVIEAAYDPAGEYPDRGCSVEVYTQGPFCEIETLGPLVTLAPGGVAHHVERWSLVAVDATADASLAAVLGKHVGE